MNETKYVPVSINLLYSGMSVPHDIFDFTQKSKLIAHGTIISDSMLERLKVFNKGNENIYVTIETEIMMRKQGLSSDMIDSLETLEEDTGYGEVKYEVLDMLEKITTTSTIVIPQKELTTVSRELSHVVDNTKPAVIVGLVNALAPVDEYLQRHCVNVSLLNGLFGKWLELPKETIDTLVLVGLLHDCGKAALPNRILSSRRGLTCIEFEVIKTHPVYSSRLLSEFPEVVQLAARGHHEKMNGKGYPDGLLGEDIPYMSRITAISDIYDAMTARRSYKGPRSPFNILGVLNGLRGTDLDPQFLDVFLNKMPDELIGKPVLLSDGIIGLVHSVDMNDIEHPLVRVGKRIIKTDDYLYCQSMYFDDAKD